MDGFIHVAAAGAKEVMLQQAINAHNLANSPTVAFKADIAQAESIYVKGAGQETRAFNRTTEVGTDFSQGTLQQTGRELDIAVSGEGWIAVQAPGGGEGLTRRGDLRIDEFGQLFNGAGEAIIGESGPIALPPFSSLSIAPDGTLSIVPLGEAPNTVAIMDRIKLVNPPAEVLRKTETGLVQTADGLPTIADGSLRITTGTLEASNVNATEAMVKMIELSRTFEQFMRMVSVGEEIDTSSASLMRIQ